MNTTRTAHATRTGPAATAAALAGLALVLTGCGGGASGSDSADGEYLRQDDGQLMSMVIDGNEVTHEVIDCESKPDEEKSSIGELNDDATIINWTASSGDFDASDGTFEVQSDVTITETAVVIPYTFGDSMASEDRELVYHLEGSDQAKDVRTEYQQECASQAEDEKDAEAGLRIQDGTYYAVGTYRESAREMTVGGTSATLRTAECDKYVNGERVEEPEVATWTGALSDLGTKSHQMQVAWESGADDSAYKATLTPMSNGGITAKEAGGTLKFYPEGSIQAQDALAEFEEACGTPFPSK